MMSLIPNWARSSEEFWNSVKERNLWFIKLRYGAVALLIFLLLTIELFLEFPLTEVQLIAISLITLCILCYNLFLHKIRKKVTPENKFNNLHLSLLQMVLDLTALTLLVHYTGGVETPFYMFYIFHMIIGSMILPGVVIYSLAVLIMLLFSLMIFLEYAAVIPHHAIYRLFDPPIYDNLSYLIVLLVVFSMMMIISVMLANKIARQLYERERQLWETLDKLEKAEAEKQRYIMGVVHEIKTPVAAVQSILDLVIEQFLGPISREISEKLKRARLRTDEAIRLINNVLHISKIKLLDQITTESVDLDKLLQEVICKYNMQADMKKVKISFISESVKVPYISGDKALLEMAFSNLIGNGVKYNSAGGIVEISITAGKQNVITRVCDNGIGIPAEDLNKVFNEFYRASNSRSFKFEGSGMGLSVVKQIIKRHGGDIRIESPSRLRESDRPGTCVTVNLPV